MTKYILVCALAGIGCVGQPGVSQDPYSDSAPTVEALAIGEPVCASWAQARPFRDHPIIAAWYATPCPVGMEVVICGSGTAAELPTSCTWFDGQPHGMSPACCPTDDTGPLTCDSDDDCPGGSGHCWEPWCNTQTGQCMQTWAFKLGDFCPSGGVCNIAGMYRSEDDGYLISEQGWPAVCDEPKFPD